MDLVRRCCDALKSGDGAQVPLLRTARELLRVLPTGDGKNKVKQSPSCSVLRLVLALVPWHASIVTLP